MQGGSSLGSRWAIYAPTKGLLVWACAGSIVATLVVGFTWGGWMIEGGARKRSGRGRDRPWRMDLSCQHI